MPMHDGFVESKPPRPHFDILILEEIDVLAGRSPPTTGWSCDTQDNHMQRGWVEDIETFTKKYLTVDSNTKSPCKTTMFVVPR